MIQQVGQVAEEQDVVDPLAQLRVLWRHRLEIGSLMLLALVLATALVFLVRPTYRATATLQIEPPKSTRVVKIEEVYEPAGITSEYQKTQYEVLRSRALAERIVSKLKIAQHPEYKDLQDDGPWWKPANLLARLGHLLPFLPGLPSGPGSEAEKQALHQARVITEFMENTEIQPVLNTNLVKIHFDAKSAALSAGVANELANSYIQRELESRSGITEKASGLLSQRLEETKAKLQASEQALQQFLENQQLVNVGGVRGLVETELTDNSARLREARRIRTELASVYQKVVAASGNVEQLQEIPQIQQQPLVHETKKGFLQAQEEYQELQSRYGPKHPKLIAAKARLDSASSSYYNQLRIRADGIKAEYEVASQTERALASQLEQSRGQIQQLDRKEYDLQVLQREVQTNRELYDTLLTRVKETGVSSEFDVGIARLVDPAVTPSRPYKPKKLLIIIAALIASLILGVLLAFLLEFIDDTVKNTQELEALTGLPILGALPIVSSIRDQASKVARIELDEPKSAFAEGMRTVRTGVILSDLDRKRKVLLVTSSIPGEGKTTVAENLALAMGQVEKVLLVDLDLRRPAVARNLGIPQGASGLTELVAGTAQASACIYRFEEGRIDVLPAGRLPPNPSEMLSSQRFQATLASLAERYDRIILDSAPCQAVSDTLLIGRIADGVIFLTKADATPRKQVRNSIKQLRRAQAPLLGVVLNQVDIRRAAEYEGGYYYKYGYYG